MNHSREDLVFLCCLSEQTERYPDMLKFIKQAIQLGGEPSIEERNLLSVAYKNLIGSKRPARRSISALEIKEESKGGPHIQFLKDLQKKIELEVEEYQRDAINFIDTSILQTCKGAESQVFFLKMKADHYRQLTESSTGEDRSKIAQEALEAYSQASEVATMGLPANDPIRLGLMLNFSVFYYEIMNDCEKACSLVKEALESAQAETDNERDSLMIQQLLRDNLSLWTSEPNES